MLFRSRVDVSASCPHEHALRGSHAHAGVHAASAVYRRDGAAVAQVAGHHLQRGRRSAEDLGGPLGDEGVARSVERITTHLGFFVVLVGNSVYKGFGWHRLVESRVEDHDVRHAGEGFPHGVYAHEIRGVVQRRQVRAVLDVLDHRVGDEGGFRVLLAAVNDAVSDGGKLVQIFDDAGLCVRWLDRKSVV